MQKHTNINLTVCLGAKTLEYQGGGHLWVFLNWALGLRSLGCRVIWLEWAFPSQSVETIKGKISSLKTLLRRYGLEEAIAICSCTHDPLPVGADEGCLSPEYIAEADILLNFAYRLPQHVVRRFRRTVLIDIDPGLLQVWMKNGHISVAKHDMYFTIGETVGKREALFPDCDLEWLYTPPCVALDWWVPTIASRDAPFTTVTHWIANEWLQRQGGQYSQNDKRTGFQSFLSLPDATDQVLELAISMGGDKEADRAEYSQLKNMGWRVRDSADVASTPWDYQKYIQESRGEFSCAKPSCVYYQNAWISDRTLCYLASGKPSVVQDTGPSKFLPNDEGLFRFHDIGEAIRFLDIVASDYDRQSECARRLAEYHFDAKKVISNVLEKAF